MVIQASVNGNVPVTYDYQQIVGVALIAVFIFYGLIYIFTKLKSYINKLNEAVEEESDRRREAKAKEEMLERELELYTQKVHSLTTLPDKGNIARVNALKFGFYVCNCKLLITVSYRDDVVTIIVTDSSSEEIFTGYVYSSNYFDFIMENLNNLKNRRYNENLQK